MGAVHLESRDTGARSRDVFPAPSERLFLEEIRDNPTFIVKPNVGLQLIGQFNTFGAEIFFQAYGVYPLSTTQEEFLRATVDTTIQDKINSWLNGQRRQVIEAGMTQSQITNLNYLGLYFLAPYNYTQMGRQFGLSYEGIRQHVIRGIIFLYQHQLKTAALSMVTDLEALNLVKPESLRVATASRLLSTGIPFPHVIERMSLSNAEVKTLRDHWRGRVPPEQLVRFPVSIWHNRKLRQINRLSRPTESEQRRRRNDQALQHFFAANKERRQLFDRLERAEIIGSLRNLIQAQPELHYNIRTIGALVDHVRQIVPLPINERNRQQRYYYYLVNQRDRVLRVLAENRQWLSNPVIQMGGVRRNELPSTYELGHSGDYDSLKEIFGGAAVAFRPEERKLFLTSDAVPVFKFNSGHYIHHDDRQQAIDKLREIIRTARKKSLAS